MEPGARSSMRGAASVRLTLLLAVLAALVLPALLALWADPALATLPGAPRAAMGRLVLLQAGAAALVLVGVWMLFVMRPIVRLKDRAMGLAGGRHSMVDSHSPGSHLLSSELGELDHHLQQAQQRITGLVDELEARHQEMHRMAMVDALTGLPNRRLFRDLFDRAASLSSRSQKPMALLFIDLDHFKEVNDRFGHPAGDELLLCIGQRLRDTVRGSDLVGRLGGDEFVALLPDTAGFDAIAHTALRLIHAIELPVALNQGQAHGEVSASIGVARYPRDGEDFDTVLQHADQAMYRAKSAGRGRYALFRPSLQDDDNRLGGDSELEQALAQGELQLHFQPVIDTASGQAVGAEALMRWMHPHEGLLPPSRFIRRAEESGQSHALGLRTLDQACAQLAQWKHMGLHTGCMSINVSAPQFHHADWADALGQALSRHHIVRGELAVELTESALMDDAECTQERVDTLRSLGVPLVIDDFGSGLISLTRLGELQPAMIKLDPAFVRRLPGDPAARAMVAGIVGLAHSLAIAVVAEGVETEDQRDALAELGCHLQQGYLFARPQPALPEPAWPLPSRPDGQPPTTRGANDSDAGDLVPLDTLLDRLPLGRG
jgi:diguanylate cyclase (GGDEF)-like protein